MRNTLFVLVFSMTCMSSIISFLLIMEPTGRLLQWNLDKLLEIKPDSLEGIGLRILLTYTIPALFCLLGMIYKLFIQYKATLILGVWQVIGSIAVVKFTNIDFWISFALLIIGLFICLISYQLMGKKLI